jgi:hypothetical protein
MEIPKRLYNRDEERIAAAKKHVSIIIERFEKTVPCEAISLKSDEIANRGANTNVELDQKAIGQIPMDPNDLSVICGTVFGDGSLAKKKGYANARMQFRHSTRQAEWVLWKCFVPFKPFVNASSIQIQAPDGFQKKAPRLPGESLGKLKVSTKVDQVFTDLMPILMENDKSHNPKKKIKRSWLNFMTAWFLVTLWLDDGSLTGGARQGNISINSATEDEAKTLAQYLDVVWGVKCDVKLYTSRKTSSNPVAPDLTFVDLDNLEKFLTIVAPLIPVKSMLYKVCLYPLDPVRLERWTSKLKTLVRPDWHDEFDRIYSYYALTKGEFTDEMDV